MGVITRRRLLGSGVVIAAAGAGIALGSTRPRHQTTRTPPARLVDAVAREKALIVSLDASLAAVASPTITAIRADHEAHRAALQALVDRATSPLQSSPAGSPTSRPLPTADDLKTAEKAAQMAAAADSAASSGALAALFASISACEAGHQVLIA
jgi:hypothetical protein